MIILYYVFGTLSFFLTCIYFHMVLARYHFKYFLKKYFLADIFLLFSILFAFIALLLGRVVFEKWDFFMAFIIAIGIFPLISTISERLKYGGIKEKTIEVTEEWKYLSSEERTDYDFLSNYKKILKTTINKKEYIIAFYSYFPKDFQNISLIVEKRTFNNVEFYICSRFINAKQGKRVYLSLLFDSYAIILATYGYFICMQSIMSLVTMDDIYLSFIFLPLAYAMFSREVYIKGIDSGKPNILQYVFLVLKILTMVELIEFLFLI